VRLHGGTLALDSTLGQGTNVTITLPADRLIAGAEAEDAEPRVARG
jgi:signal transduction histidine kinase